MGRGGKKSEPPRKRSRFSSFSFGLSPASFQGGGGTKNISRPEKEVRWEKIGVGRGARQGGPSQDGINA